MEINSLQKQAVGLIFGLGLEFLLGMYVALYVAFPENKTEVQNWDFIWSQPVVLAHVILGTALLFGAGFIVYKAFRIKNRLWKISGITGLAFSLLAFGGGERYVTTQNDIFSMLMAIGFIGALLTYARAASLRQE